MTDHRSTYGGGGGAGESAAAAGSEAPGAPGIEPTWSSSAKDAVGTSTLASRVWFTVGRGILNEVYWPRVDRPETRDLGFIVADDTGFWSEVKRDATHTVSYEEPGIPAVLVRHVHDAYELRLRICADDHGDVVRIEAVLTDRRPDDRPRQPLRLYALIAPHLGFTGFDNRAWIGAYKGHSVLLASRGPSCLALAASPTPLRSTVGFVGESDGWQDFDRHGRMTWTYATAGPGNVAGMLELAPGKPDAPDVAGGPVGGDSEPVGRRAELALAFGSRWEEAALLATQAMTTIFDDQWRAYVDGWRTAGTHDSPPPSQLDADLASEYRTSAAVLRVHQDRAAPGATVASLSIPWGNSRNDLGGYHLVWSRDLVETAGAFVALGAHSAARRTLAYLAATQEPDGHWIQNQWVDGVPYWRGIQLDEAAYPILLVGALRTRGATHMHGQAHRGADFERLLTELALDEMACRAAGFLARNGPLTQQDRWEENGGLTPSTIAPVIAALVVAARLLEEPSATYCLELADDWNAAIEDWTFACGGPLAEDHGVDGYYVRIASPEVLNGAPIATPVPIRNRRSGHDWTPADRMVGTDFLSLVRFGLRAADDPGILSTIAVTDALLRSWTPSGDVWHRYTGDGYGEHADGSPYDGTGIGRGWPLLVGERGHYELQAGHDALPFLDAMRRMASDGGMIPEQVWDVADIPERGLFTGRPSGSAMPLAWAHAEFVKLARSIAVGYPIDRPADAWDRYHGVRPKRIRATWRFGAARPSMPTGTTLRLELLAPVRVHYTLDRWLHSGDVEARDTGLGVWVADIPGSAGFATGSRIDFTFFWSDAPGGGHWEGRDFGVEVGPAEA